MNRKTLLLILGALVAGILIGGVGQSRFDLLGPHGHDADEHAGHDHGEGSAQITVWTERFEIFLEHPPIIVDTPTEFVTHISNLLTAEPRTKGPVTFVLSQGSGPALEHRDPAPARNGIYIPKLVFPRAGQWNVSLVIPSNGQDYVVTLPPFQVYASDEEADQAPAPEEIDGISFLKEQQWKRKAATQPVRLRQIANATTLAVPESAIIDEGDEHVAFVQLAGETFEERTVTLGASADGFVQVLAGLAENERLVTKGAEAVEEAAHEGLHGDEQVVHLTDEDIKRFEIEVAIAGPGEIDVHVQLPGQIAFNTDRMAHIVPSAAGVVRKVLKNVGDKVKASDILAWLESADLGKAKLEYLTRLAEVGCCAMDLTRTQQVHASTIKLLETLKSTPSLDTLSQISGTAMDSNHTTLVSAYAELVLAKSAYLREKSLFEKEIGREQDYLTAENQFKKAEAKYAASRSSITFQVQKSLIDAQRDQQVRLIGLKSAERSLYVLGLTAEDINDIELLGRAQPTASAEEEICTDPNCTECNAPATAKSGAGKEKIAWYPLRAPFDATVIEKHITLGEKLTDESNAFAIADISSVWINLNVHQKHLPLVKPGQQVRIAAGAAAPEVRGTISYVSPVVGLSTRTTLARVVLDNSSGILRPGTFITADVMIDKAAVPIAVNKDILQDMDECTIVFVQTDHGFEPRDVTVGRTNDVLVEITSGLEPGETIVTKNSFRLKAELQKDTGGGHAGHAH